MCCCLLFEHCFNITSLWMPCHIGVSGKEVAAGAGAADPGMPLMKVSFYLSL